MPIYQMMQVTVIDPAATGRKAREARETKGLKLREAARALGFCASYISELELGKRNWDGKAARKYVAFLVK